MTKAKLAAVKKAPGDNLQNSFRMHTKLNSLVQTSVDEKYNVSAEMFFNEGSVSSLSVFGSDRKYWSQEMKMLGLTGVSGYPYQLSPLKTKIPLPIPAVDFAEAVQSTAKIYNEEDDQTRNTGLNN